MKDSTRALVKHHILWGLGLGAAASASTQILTWLGLGLTHWTWASIYALVVLFALLAARSLGHLLGERPRFWRTVLMLAVVILVSRFVYQSYMFVYIRFVDPSWVETVVQVWTVQLQEAGATEEAVARSIANFRRTWETGFIFTLGILQFGIAQFALAVLVATGFVVQPWTRRTHAPR